MAQPRKTSTDRDQLRRVINPLDVVVITRARLQEIFDEAVARGRITRGDAADLVSDVLARGRGQAEDLLAELEQLLGAPIEAARRVTGLGAEFPITGYDDLTGAEVVAEPDGKSPPHPPRGGEDEAPNA